MALIWAVFRGFRIIGEAGKAGSDAADIALTACTHGENGWVGRCWGTKRDIAMLWTSEMLRFTPALSGVEGMRLSYPTYNWRKYWESSSLVSAIVQSKTGVLRLTGGGRCTVRWRVGTIRFSTTKAQHHRPIAPQTSQTEMPKPLEQLRICCNRNPIYIDSGCGDASYPA